MVMYALAVVLLPLAMAGNMAYHQQQMGNMGHMSNGAYGVQMTGMMVPQGQMQMMQQYQQGHQQQQQQQNGQWWSLQNPEEYAAYLKWCEERRMAIAEQEQQQALLHEIQERAEEQEREREREKASKEMQMKHDAMMAQWKMWQAQLSQADEFDGMMEKFTEMKIHYMFKLTMEFLKFCRCADETVHLQRYLIYGGEGYEAATGATEAFDLEDLNGIDITNVDAVAQRLATLSQAQQVKAFYGGIVNSMCDAVKSYIQQIRAWETQYNFLGM